jgi:hypothetical protein
VPGAGKTAMCSCIVRPLGFLVSWLAFTNEAANRLITLNKNSVFIDLNFVIDLME